MVLAAAVVLCVLLLRDVAAGRWLSPALAGLAGCVPWLCAGSLGRAGRRAGWFAVPVLVGAVLWFGSSWFLPEERPPPTRYTTVIVVGSKSTTPPQGNVAEPMYTLREAESPAVRAAAPSRPQPVADAIGAGAAVLALVGIGLVRPVRLREVRRPIWDVREVLLIGVGVALGWVGRAEWAGRPDRAGAPEWWVGAVALGLVALALWLARSGPPGDRPRWLAGATLGLLAVALGLGLRAAWVTPPADLGVPVPGVLILVAFALVLTAPLGTAVRAARRWLAGNG
ncbi:hypothetical protein GCM10020369_09660 [Cryptosporangium minutisporangium]|uniref:Uncharacterized protein n=1 Tax=Cryptosporangium minutisporangium TaxID=113569 RepID=A0ABP6SSL3_9ACTN